jgi:hypothetical protein
MKLMRFNESKTKLLAYRKTITTIKEILLEFEDRGFKPKIYQNGGHDQLTVIIESDSMNSFTKDLTINIDDDSSIFEMLFDYLEYTYELYLIRWVEGDIHQNWPNSVDEYKLSEQDEVYPTFHEVLKNRQLSKIVLFFNPSTLTKLMNK